MSNYEDLVKWRERVGEDEVRRQMAKARAASAASRRRLTTISACLKAILAADAEDPEAADRLSQMGLDATVAGEIALAVTDRSRSTGDPVSSRLALEAVEGKMPDRVELTGADGRPIEALDLSKLSDDELRKLISDRKSGPDVAQTLHQTQDE